AGWIRADGGKLYVTCTGDFNDGSGQGIVEVDPSGKGSVTRSVHTPVSPSGLAVTASRIWFGDGGSGNVYAIDRGSFTVTAGPIALQCPSTGTYQTTNELAVLGGDVYALCSNGD